MTLQFDDVREMYPEAQLIGEGGQKVVFSIEHPEYGPAVLKVGAYQSQGALERIQREVALLSVIDSPFYPKHYEFTVLDHKRFYLIEERIDGAPLSSSIGEFGTAEDATQLVGEIAVGLRELWDRHVVHRDVKYEVSPGTTWNPMPKCRIAETTTLMTSRIKKLMKSIPIISPFSLLAPGHVGPRPAANCSTPGPNRTQKLRPQTRGG
jgi:serine/threonine protein kinase